MYCDMYSRKGVEFCKEGTNSDRETLSRYIQDIIVQYSFFFVYSKTTNGADVNAEELLRYPGGVTRLAHLAVQSMCIKVCMKIIHILHSTVYTH